MENLKETLPAGMAEVATSIPGVGAILQLILNKLGFDVGSTMSLYLLLFGLFQGALLMYTKGRRWLLWYGSSKVVIEDKDDLYAEFIAWISQHRMTKVSRDLKATSKNPSRRNNEVDEEGDSDTDSDDVLDDSGIFNYEKYKSATPVYYQPNIGEDNFFHDGHYFQFSKEIKDDKFSSRTEYFLTIRCMGRSTKPVKDLIEHIKGWSARKDRNMTEIRRATDMYGGSWMSQAIRPSRPISTVTLDEVQKNRVIGDINEYLHPATARWYASRGIPHRRGYLFHGPPGTGKTSLSFAIAGIFGLRIYCASLSEREISESDLARLFSKLPDRCVVLLEDIDSAGIRRDRSSVIPETGHASDTNEADKSSAQTTAEATEEEGEKKDSKDEKKTEEKQKDSTDNEKKQSIRRRITRSLFPRQITDKPDSETTESTPETESPPPEPIDEEGSQSHISLAGLLNIIDGAASNEGRVLIMTTNYPEKLDSALIRPGRVDLQIKFTLATKMQMGEIFQRMYSSEADTKRDARKKKSPGSKSKRKTRLAANSSTSTSVSTPAVVLPARPSFATLPPDRLVEMARQFAQALPEATFSPAEVQGYLLQEKVDAQGALDGVVAWRDVVLEAKKKGSKVVELE